jgi:hypothetical protein
MRKYIFAIFVPFAILVTIFTGFQNYRQNKSADNLTLSSSFDSDQNLSTKLENIIAQLDKRLKSNQELLNHTRSNQEQLSRRFSVIEAKFKNLESANFDDTNAENKKIDISENKRKPELSEQNFAKWLNESLTLGFIDNADTIRATDEARQNLAKIPEINLETMKCSDLICKATFSYELGARSAIQNVFGEPPFMTEGFTVDEPDGTVSLYFVKPGESIENLRKEAMEDSLQG